MQLICMLICISISRYFIFEKKKYPLNFSFSFPPLSLSLLPCLLFCLNYSERVSHAARPDRLNRIDPDPISLFIIIVAIIVISMVDGVGG